MPEKVEKLARELRSRLEPAFSPETAIPGLVNEKSPPSRGQCAAVAVVAHEVLGGEFVSAIVNGESHWFNRVRSDDRAVDIDLTGDQFGFPSIQIKDAGALYPGTRVRVSADIREETKARARLLAERAHISVKVA